MKLVLAAAVLVLTPIEVIDPNLYNDANATRAVIGRCSVYNPVDFTPNSISQNLVLVIYDLFCFKNEGGDKEGVLWDDASCPTREI